MNTLFVANGSSDIGMGHVIRCQSLLQTLALRSHRCFWAMKGLPGAPVDRAAGTGAEVIRLHPALLPDEAWKTVLAYAKDLGIDFLVSDDYDTVHRHFQAALGAGLRLLILDDIADREYSGDLLLNQNATDGGIYRGKADRVGRLLLGPEFALLRPEFSVLAEVPDARNRPERVLITMGGADRYNLTHDALAALQDMDVSIDVVMGPYYAHEVSLGPLLNGRVTIHRNVTSLLPLMQAAGWMVCSAGSTVWEGCRAGLPMVVVQTVKNQDQVAARIVSSHAAIFLGHRDTVTQSNFRMASEKLVEDVCLRMQLSLAGRRLVDGRGAERVAAAMEKVMYTKGQSA